MAATEHSIELARVAAQAAADKLGQDIAIIDVSEQLIITDCFVVITASNERQVGAIHDAVEEAMQRVGVKPVRREGAKEGRWILLDFVDIVAHVQHTDERNFYDLPRLWRDCPQIPFVDASAAPTDSDASGVPADSDASAAPTDSDASGVPADSDASGVPTGTEDFGMEESSTDSSEVPDSRAQAQRSEPNE